MIVSNVKYLTTPKPGFGLGFGLDDSQFYVFELITPDASYSYGQILTVKDEQRASIITFEQADQAFFKATEHHLSIDGNDLSLKRQRKTSQPRERVFETADAALSYLSESADSPSDILGMSKSEIISVADALSSQTEETGIASGNQRVSSQLGRSRKKSQPVQDVTSLLPQPVTLKKKRDIGADVFIFIRYGGFILASIVSALFNIFLFTSLDKSYIWLLICFSVALEFTKISSVVGAHLFKDLYVKTRLKRLIHHQVIWYGAYFSLALFSIIASLGFSLTVTAKSDAVRTADLEALQAHRQAVYAKMLEIDEQSVIERISLDEYEPYLNANIKFIEAEDLYQEANTAYQGAVAARLRTQADSPERLQAQREESALYQERQASLTARNSAREERGQIEVRFNERKLQSTEARQRLDAELQVLIRQANLDTTIGSVALLELDAAIKSQESRILDEKGLSYMFEQFALYLGWSVANVKLLILMFASLMLELTIFTSSPDIRLTRRILHFFIFVLPRELDIEDLLKRLDADDRRFS